MGQSRLITLCCDAVVAVDLDGRTADRLGGRRLKPEPIHRQALALAMSPGIGVTGMPGKKIILRLVRAIASSPVRPDSTTRK